jgi:hypothetical protein
MLEKAGNPLRYLQIGDLHVTDAGLQNHLDLRRIVEEVNGSGPHGTCSEPRSGLTGTAGNGERHPTVIF